MFCVCGEHFCRQCFLCTHVSLTKLIKSNLIITVTGQPFILQNIAVQCFDSSPTCDSASLNVARTDLFTAERLQDEINHCCFFAGGILRSDRSNSYYRLGTGECRSCLRKLLSTITILHNESLCLHKNLFFRRECNKYIFS